jgi:hypothetical protein
MATPTITRPTPTLETLDDRLTTIEFGVRGLTQFVQQRFVDIEARFDAVDGRLGAIEGTLNELLARLPDPS